MEQFKENPGVQGGQGRSDKKVHEDAVWFFKVVLFAMAALGSVLVVALCKNGVL